MNDEPYNEGRKYDLEDRLLHYAADIMRLVDTLRRTMSARHIASQLLRSGTNPLGSHGEAQSAESVRDFIHKFRIGLKELRESFRWLRLIQLAQLHENASELERLIDETEQLIRIFNASIHTASKRLASKP